MSLGSGGNYMNRERPIIFSLIPIHSYIIMIKKAVFPAFSVVNRNAITRIPLAMPIWQEAAV